MSAEKSQVSSLLPYLLNVLWHLIVLLIADDSVHLALLAVNEKLLVDHLLDVFVVLNVQSKFFYWRSFILKWKVEREGFLLDSFLG